MKRVDQWTIRGLSRCPGERLLWTGRPVRPRINRVDAALVAYMCGALAVGTIWFRPPTKPVIIDAIVAGSVVWRLVLKPLSLRRCVYLITDYRILVTPARWVPARTAYLDQIDVPTLKPRRDGTADLALGPVIELLALTDAAQAREVILTARKQMRAGGPDQEPSAPGMTR